MEIAASLTKAEQQVKINTDSVSDDSMELGESYISNMLQLWKNYLLAFFRPALFYFQCDIILNYVGHLCLKLLKIRLYLVAPIANNT